MNWALAVKGWACRVLGGQWVGLQGLRGSGGGPTGLQGVNGYAKRVPKGQGVGLQGPRGSTMIRFFLRTYGLTEVFQEALADLKSLGNF